MIGLKGISRIGLGTSRSASLGRRLDPTRFGYMVDLMQELGQNLIDTSDFYGSGDAERLVRKAIKKRRENFFVITKAGLPTVPLWEIVSPVNQLAKKLKQRLGARPDFSASNLFRRLESSLGRLGVDSVDGFMLHEPVAEDIGDGSCWRALEEIRKKGWARFTGVSTNDIRVVKAGVEAGQVQFVQTFSAWNHPESDDIVALCRSENIPLILNRVIEPLASLSSRYAERQSAIHRLDGLQGMSCIQFLISAALIGKEADSVLTGTLNLQHLRHNIEALGYIEPLATHWCDVEQLLS